MTRGKQKYCNVSAHLVFFDSGSHALCVFFFNNPFILHSICNDILSMVIIKNKQCSQSEYSRESKFSCCCTSLQLVIILGHMLLFCIILLVNDGSLFQDYTVKVFLWQLLQICHLRKTRWLKISSTKVKRFICLKGLFEMSV